VIPNTLENLTFRLETGIDIGASPEVAFEALLEQVGPLNETPAGDSLAMKLEPWPGGRWYRDLGGDDGHLWGHVQAIKRPTLLEIAGPLFMSYAAISNVQYRLMEVDGKTRLAFRHSAFGLLEEAHRKGMSTGWTHILQRIRAHAEHHA